MMKWRALLRNQWFQLCLLVALLSGATTIYNTVNVKSTSSSGAASRPSSTPPPVRKISPKKPGQWILDASGARDSDSKDIQIVAASLTEGDLVTVRPGTYTGSCEIAVSARFVGPAPGTGIATIRCVEPKRAGMSISGKKVSLENLSINLDCSTSTQAKFGVYVHENASLTAENSHFQASGKGCCLKYEGTSRGSLGHCTFSGGQWGLEVNDAAQIEASNCAFQKLGLANGNGNTVSIMGEHASAKLDTCEFTENTATVFADKGATLTVIGCTFRNNGITDDAENVNTGLVCVRNKAKAFLRVDNFDNNKQGVVATMAGNVTLQNARMHQTGLVTANQKIAWYSNAVAASGEGTTMIVDDCYIADSPSAGFLISSGAHLKAAKTVVSNSGKVGLQLGVHDSARSSADLDSVQFIDSPGNGAMAEVGSQLTMRGCRVSDIGHNGIAANDQGTRVNMSETWVKNCQECGLMAISGATISVTGGTIESNKWGAQAGLPNDPAKSGTILLTGCAVQGNTLGLAACQGATLTMKGGTLEKNRSDTTGEVRVER